MSAAFSLRVAAINALHTLWGGLIFLGLYLLVMIFGPGIDGKFFPVVTSYQLTNVRHLNNGGITFEPVFNKTRDCTYYGVNWFAPDERGNLTRIQIRRSDAATPSPQTGPVGPRVGERQYIVPPAGTSEIYGIMHHDCNFLWQTRTTVGPFSMEDGRLLKRRG